MLLRVTYITTNNFSLIKTSYDNKWWIADVVSIPLYYLVIKEDDIFLFSPKIGNFAEITIASNSKVEEYLISKPKCFLSYPF